MNQPELDLVRGTLDLLILKTLSWGPMHGLAVMRWIQATTHDQLQIEEGALYPALHRMESKGWLGADWGYTERNRKAKFYRLTAAGRKHLDRRADALAALHERRRSGHLGAGRSAGAMRRVFRVPGGGRRLEREVDDEFRFHLEGRVEELMERDGLSRDDAEREAKRRFGDYAAYRREARSIDDVILHRRNRMELFDAVRRETRHAARALGRAPSFSLIAALTLALGLGAATTIFTLLDRVVIRPLPYPNADRLIHLGTLWPKVKEGEEYMLSKGQYFYFKKNSTGSRRHRDVRRGHAASFPGTRRTPPNGCPRST